MTAITNTKTLTVGCEVGVAARHGYSVYGVAKITPTGKVTLTNGWVFNNAGRQVKSPGIEYPSQQLVSLERVAEARAEQAHQKATVAAVVALEEALRGRRNGLGKYNLTPAQVAALAALAADIATDTTAEVATEIVAAL
jgi:hypothetical protein